MSVSRAITIPHTYRDSVVLMELSRDLAAHDGVEQAAAMMATPANLDVLQESGLLASDLAQAGPSDLIVAVAAADDQTAEKAIAWASERLVGKGLQPTAAVSAAPGHGWAYKGWQIVPEEARLALISTPGPYAAAEAWKALRRGLHVFLFSDRVSLEDEVALKDAAQARRLLLMGPEAGTSLINGVPIGFANNVSRGPIGIVAASGTGLQEVTSLIDRLGSGISHGIGVGGRDLSLQVGGRTMAQAIDWLLDDPATEVLLLISKPPAHTIARQIVQQVAQARKPVVICFIGADERLQKESNDGNVTYALTLEEAAQRTVSLATGSRPQDMIDPPLPPLTPGNRQLRGLFSGGTLAYEAMIVMQDRLGPIWSNKPLDPAYQLDEQGLSNRHVCLDLGAEEYTTISPHPMIDPGLRREILLEQVRDPQTGVILLDFVLGYGSHSDPVGALLPAIVEAQELAQSEGRPVLFVASVVGTEKDPQPRSEQVYRLALNGVIVAHSNAGAARVAARALRA